MMRLRFLGKPTQESKDENCTKQTQPWTTKEQTKEATKNKNKFLFFQQLLNKVYFHTILTKE